MKPHKNKPSPSVKSLYEHSDESFGEDTSYQFSNEILDHDDMQRADELYVDSLIMQAVDVPVRDSLENWRSVSDSTLSSVDEALQYRHIFHDATINVRKYGCTMIVPVLVDQDNRRVSLNTPLDTLLQRPDKTYTVLKLIIFKEYRESDQIEKNILSDNFGKPKKYLVNNKPIDPSRCVIVQANSAKISFIRSIYSYFCSFKTRDFEVTRATQESNWVILKTDMAMLQEIAQAKVEVGSKGSVEDHIQDALMGRLRDLRDNANNNNAYGIDREGEDIEMISKVNIKQMVEAVDQALMLLNAAADIPMRRFLGRGVGGLGENNDDEVYVQALIGLRDSILRVPLFEMDSIMQKINPAINSLDYEWNDMAIQELISGTDDAPENQ